MTQRGFCCALTGTLTQAQRAQKVLANAAIPTTVSKALPNESRRGCAWSVGFSCNQAQNVRNILATAGISVRAWEGE